MRKFLILLCFLGVIANAADVSFANNSILSKGINGSTQSAIESNSLQNSAAKGVAAGFYCPALATIQDASIPGGEDHEVAISEINFDDGTYTCTYHFLSKNNFYELKRVNPLVKEESDAIKKLKADSMPTSMIIANNFGLFTLDKTINLPADLKQLQKNLLTGLGEISKTYASLGTSVDLRKSIDSHTDHSNTLSSIFLGIITADPEFIQGGGAVVDSSGALRLENASAGGLNKDGSKTTVKDITKLTGLTDTIDSKFWGYYNLLMINVNYYFASFVQLTFSLGVIIGFGYVFGMNLLKSEQSTVAFDFKAKFMTVFAGFAFFLAPIIPSNANVPDEYLYYSKGEQKVHNINQTPAHVFLRYTFQFGTFLANQINDAALFSYLKYVSSEYGHFSPVGILENFNGDVQRFVSKTKGLENRLYFFEKTCAQNYATQLFSNSGLPSYSRETVITSNIFNKDANNLKISRVDYEVCHALYASIQRDSNKYLIEYQKMLTNYNNLSTTLKKMKTTDIQELNDFLTFVTNMNNAYGWVSAIAVPSITHILETKEIVKYASSKESETEAAIANIGKMKSSEQKMSEAEDEVKEAMGKEGKPQELRFWEKLLKKIGIIKDSAFDPVHSFVSENITGPIIGSAAGYSIYYMLPGFNDIFDLVLKTGIIENITSLISNLADNAIKAGVAMTGPLGRMISAGVEAVGTLGDMMSSTTGDQKEGAKGFIDFILAYLFAMFLYTFIITTISLVMITIIILLKIVFYFVDVIISFFVASAVVFWTVTFNQQNAVNALSKFFWKMALLSITPASIVMSIYVFMFSNAALYYLFHNFIELVYAISMRAQHDLDSNTIAGTYTSIQFYAIYTISDIIFTFISILLAYVVLFKFHDRVIEFLGADGESGIGKYASKLFDNLQGKMSKV